MQNNWNNGKLAEAFFHSKMNLVGVPCKFVDDYYDFDIGDDVKVEVKSCQLSIKDSKESGCRVGRYDFTSLDSRELLVNDDVWVCFIVRCENSCIFQGFVKAKKLGLSSKKRYISIHQVKDLECYTFLQWLDEVQKVD